MIIKVCGMREAENIRSVEQLGVDYMGFIFWPGSSRYVPTPPDYLPVHCKRVGVFVNSDINDIIEHCIAYQLDAIQLHGSECSDDIRRLRTALSDKKVTIIKAISVSCPEDIDTYRDYCSVVDLFLFDTKCTTVGGSGRQFDWTVLANYDGDKPFLLSGGIGPDDAVRIHDFHHPRLAGIDLNSRFESAPAVKDITKLKIFLQAL